MVPFNPWASLRNDSHVSVEIVVSSKSPKSLTNYPAKGGSIDRAMVARTRSRSRLQELIALHPVAFTPRDCVRREEVKKKIAAVRKRKEWKKLDFKIFRQSPSTPSLHPSVKSCFKPLAQVTSNLSSKPLAKTTG